MLKLRINKYKSTSCKCIVNFIEAIFYTSGLHSQSLLSCYNLRFSSAAANSTVCMLPSLSSSRQRTHNHFGHAWFIILQIICDESLINKK